VWSSIEPNSQVTAPKMPVSATNTTSSLTSPTRVGSRQLARLRRSLSERDWQVLRLVAGHRYLSSGLVEAFCFDDHATPASGARTARRVLRRLAESGLLVTLGRRVGGVRAGSSSYVWQLAPAGARLLMSGDSPRRPHEPSPRFLDHCLSVANVHLQLLGLQRQGRLEQVSVQLEPDCWRGFVGPGGERRLLQPDLYVRTVTARYEDRWFIEVDLGTESLPTLLGKCAQYEIYRASGSEQAASGVFPLVVWHLSTAARRDALATRIARSAALTPQLYRLALPGELPGLVVGSPP
jgi:hypothetical protein